MSTSDPAAQRARLENAIRAISSLKSRVAELESEHDEPIAVVGMACRFPGGADTPDDFWRLLREGRDAVTEIPPERWNAAAYYDPDPDAVGKSYTKSGGFIGGIDRFDAGFFGVSPREAVGLDPQHRLLLETSWSALENAGIAPDRLAGTPVGVFVGITGSDYAELSRRAGAEALDAYHSTGITTAFAAGRVAYTLGLTGPAVSVDTACSSSLSAVHLACQSLRAGDCTAAVVGGVSAILTPEMYVTLSRARMLSRVGRCATFSADADGFARGEGCGVVVLKRLSAAIACGDPVLALIRGSATNQDGASSGITVPSRVAQERVVSDALKAARVQPREIQYVEAHGTGTPLGDPIELRALGAVLGTGRDPDAPFLVGSVKTNIGHLEAAAGIAGLIKVILMLRHREIPPHLHYSEPSPHIPWAEIPVRVPTAALPWQAREGRRIAGVSAFGASGTNVHLVIEEASTPVSSAVDEGRTCLLPLSARSDDELREQAARFADHLRRSTDALIDISATASIGRTHFSRRLAVTGTSREEIAGTLERFRRDGEAPGLVHGQAPAGDPPRVAFLFSGQGSQLLGVGRGLFETEPLFRSTLEQCDALLRPHLEHPLLSVLHPRPEASAQAARLLEQTAYAQPALFALQVALARLWRAWGIEPAALLGHSVGEFAAACLAGVFSLEEGLRLVAERARLMQALPHAGAMVAVRAGEARVAEAIARYGDRLSIAAYNAPEALVVSGARAEVEELTESLRRGGVECQALAVSHAFHSELLEPMLTPLERAAEGVELRAPTLRLVSGVSGALAGGEVASAAYWRRQAREPVRFEAGVRTLAALGCTSYVEIGPGSVLLGMAGQIVPDGLRVASLRGGSDEEGQMLTGLARLYASGVTVDWERRYTGRETRKVWLPTYPFRGARYWVESRLGGRSLPPAVTADDAHPLLGRLLRVAGRHKVFEAQLSANDPHYLADHRVRGAVILPAAAFIEMCVAAIGAVFGGDGEVELEDLTLHEPLVLASERAATIQTVVQPRGDDTADLEIYCLDDSGEGGKWRLHAGCTARRRPSSERSADAVSIPVLSDGLLDEVAIDRHYEELTARGIESGETFRCARSLRRSDGKALLEASLPHLVAEGATRYRLHPTLLDGCLQSVSAALGSRSETFLPLSFGRVRVRDGLPERVWSSATIQPRQSESDTVRADVLILDESGRNLVEIADIALRRVSSQPAPPPDETDEWLYEVAWEPQPLAAQAAGASSPSLMESLAGSAEEHPGVDSNPDADLHARLWPPLDQLCAAYALEALGALGWEPAPGENVSADELARRLGVVPRFNRLLDRFLDIFSEDGFAIPSAHGGWTISGPPRYPESGTVLAGLQRDFPDCTVELGLVARCGNQLVNVLLGQADPLDLLFPGGSMEEAEHLYRKSPITRGHNRQVAEVVARVASSLPTDRLLRVLEIGGGTGGTTGYVLPVLPAHRTDYRFTDISPAFSRRAQSRFASFPFVSGRALDISHDPEKQGFEPHSFDLVIAANSLHAAPDLRTALRNARKLLAPGGVMVLLEGLEKQRFADITVGLTDGWWTFADPELRDYPLIGREGWVKLLREEGFEAAAGGGGPVDRQGVLVGRVAASAAPDHGSWLILADERGMGEALAARLRAAGAETVLLHSGDVQASPADPAPMGVTADPAGGPGVFESLLRGVLPIVRPLEGVVHLWALDDEPGSFTASSDPRGALLTAAQRRVAGGALHLVQALVERGESPRVCLVTRGAQAVIPGEHVNPVHSPLWGLGRTVAFEHPELRCVRLDMDPDPDPGAAETLFAEIFNEDGEEGVALRGGQRYVERLRRRSRSPAVAESLAGDAPYRLATSGARVLENLTFKPLERRPPGPGEVEVEVSATALAFRDVLNALGEYPGPEIPLGGDFAGRAVRVGEGVVSLREGDLVLGMVAGAFASYVTAPAQLVARKPAGLSMAAAAAVPSAFLTAHHALHDLAKMGQGDRVLIHAGAGGVGLAAIQVARRAGAEVFATAGSPAKRAYLASLGVPHVFDSRSLDFSDEILRRTGGIGVDVVLNSLADDFIPASLRCLGTSGRFVELGKRSAWAPERVADARPDAAYFMVDLAAESLKRPALIERLFAEVLGGFAAGELEPLRHIVRPIAEAEAAFRFMAQARQTGRIVLVHPVPTRLREDGTYLITGGLGGVGLRTARWMVERGARNLVLVGRRAPSEEAQLEIAELERSGARVRVVQADVSRAEEVDDLISKIEPGLPPLRGVFHSALVLDDGAIIQQSWPRFETVFGPRVLGAWLLHARTHDLPLDFFVLASAAGGLLGAPGQANYTAANAFLDSLAHHRRSIGLPALSVQWGLWGDVGRAAGADVQARMAAQGVRPMHAADALSALDSVLRHSGARPEVAIMNVDWPAYFAQERAHRARLPLLAALREKVRGTGTLLEKPKSADILIGGLHAALAAAPVAKRSLLITSHVETQVAKVLGLEADFAFDRYQPLHDLGLDSLMAVELRTLLGQGLHLPRALAATIAFDYPTIDALSGYLMRQLFPAASSPAVGISLLAASDVEAMSDAEAEEALLTELAAARSAGS